MKERIHIGTSGWSYKHWWGNFYPRDVKPARFLEYYTQHFDCTELNASFYRLPKPQTVQSWVVRTPPDFKMCPKLSRLITHQKKLRNSEEALRTFFEVMQPLSPKMGPILIQLPPSFRFQEAVTRDFFELLRQHYASYTFALEVRHESWFVEEALQLLSDYGIAFVIAHSGGRFPYYEAVTASTIYLRFHGPERLYASNYPDSQLLEFAEKMAGWVETGHDVWAFFNNDVGGYAVRNALTLRSQIYQLLAIST